MKDYNNPNPLRGYCDYLRNQDECACPVRSKNLKEAAPNIYSMGYRQISDGICIYAADGTFDKCSYCRVNEQEI